MLKAQQKAGIVADVLKRVRVTLVVHQVCRWQFPVAQGETRDFLETDGQRSVNPKLFPVKMMKPFGSPRVFRKKNHAHTSLEPSNSSL